MFVIKTEWSVGDRERPDDWGDEYYIAFSREETIEIVNELKIQHHSIYYDVVYDETPDHYGTWYTEVLDESYFTIEVYETVNYKEVK